MASTRLPPELLGAIAADLYDDAPRLVLADWLEQQGDTARAEFIRVQCELEPIRDRRELPRAAWLHEREDALLGEHRERWLGALPQDLEDPAKGLALSFRRGVVDTASMPVRTFLELGSELRARFPTLRRVVLFRVEGYGEALARCPALQGLCELELACWYSDQDAAAIARSPYLSSLRVLEIWLGRGVGLSDSRLCEIMGGSAAWPELWELSLLHPEGVHRKKRLVTANRAAGREIARYQPGYSERFTFAPDIGRGLFPGRLPDGRMALALLYYQGRDALQGISFHDTGERTSQTFDLAVPEELLYSTASAADQGDFVWQCLREALGMVPAYIRVCPFSFPCDAREYYTPRRGHEEEWARMGLPDQDTETSWREAPGGHGQRLSWLIREGQFEMAWQWQLDKRGRIHTG